MKTLMVAAGISTLLIHSPALAQESAKVLSIHNGQQLLIEAVSYTHLTLPTKRIV